MTNPLFCPRCKGNRTRFNRIKQIAEPIKLDALSGEVVNQYEDGIINDTFHNTYHGSDYLIQCASCGNIDEEHTFIKTAQVHPPGQKF